MNIIVLKILHSPFLNNYSISRLYWSIKADIQPDVLLFLSFDIYLPLITTISVRNGNVGIIGEKEK